MFELTSSIRSRTQMRSTLLFGIAATVSTALSCDSCYGPANEVVHERNVRRMQPEASNATVGPKAPLEWGQLNFLHTVSPAFSLFLDEHHVRIFEADSDRPILMVGSKVISRSRTMVLIGVTLFHSPDTCNTWQATSASICCWLILVSNSMEFWDVIEADVWCR